MCWGVGSSGGVDQFNSTAHLLPWWLPGGGRRYKNRKHLSLGGRESFLGGGRGDCLSKGCGRVGKVHLVEAKGNAGVLIDEMREEQTGDPLRLVAMTGRGRLLGPD